MTTTQIRALRLDDAHKLAPLIAENAQALRRGAPRRPDAYYAERILSDKTAEVLGAFEGDKLVGAVMYGDTADGNWFFDKIKSGESIEEMRETLIFGPAYQGGAAVDPLSAVAALPRDAEICGCNGICKGTIVDAIAGGATDLGAVRATTKASGSCGTCTGLVEQLLQVTLGDDFQMPAAQPGTRQGLVAGAGVVIA